MVFPNHGTLASLHDLDADAGPCLWKLQTFTRLWGRQSSSEQPIFPRPVSRLPCCAVPRTTCRPDSRSFRAKMLIIASFFSMALHCLNWAHSPRRRSMLVSWDILLSGPLRVSGFGEFVYRERSQRTAILVARFHLVFPVAAEFLSQVSFCACFSLWSWQAWRRQLSNYFAFLNLIT